MQIIDVNAYQRTAFGGNVGAVTTIYAMGFTEVERHAGVYLDTTDWSDDLPDDYTVYAMIRIHHPIIVWGNANDVMQDYYRIAMQSLMDCGMVAYNDYYTPLWVIEEVASHV